MFAENLFDARGNAITVERLARLVAIRWRDDSKDGAISLCASFQRNYGADAARLLERGRELLDEVSHAQ